MCPKDKQLGDKHFSYRGGGQTFLHKGGGHIFHVRADGGDDVDDVDAADDDV